MVYFITYLFPQPGIFCHITVAVEGGKCRCVGKEGPIKFGQEVLSHDGGGPSEGPHGSESKVLADPRVSESVL